MCWREYDEFVILSKSLRRRFEGAATPPLPEAFVAVSRVSGSQLRFRVCALRCFLLAVLRHPYLRSDETVQLFLEANETFDQRAVDNLSSGKSSPKARWKDLLSFVHTPQQHAELLKSVKTELRAVGDVYSSLLKDLKSLSSRLSSHAGTLKQLNVSLDSWHSVERTDLHILSALVTMEARDADSVTLASVLEKMQQANDDDRKRDLSKAKQIVEVMKFPIQYELLVVQAYLTELEMANEAISVHSKLQKGSRKGEAHSAGTATKTSIALDKAKAKMQTLVRGLLVVELNRHRYERGYRNLKVLRELAELQASVASAEAKQWKVVIAAMPRQTSCGS